MKRTTSGKESRASCQGTTFHFPDMRLRQEGVVVGGGVARCVRQQVRLGLPLPGGRKSMWFLSYLREGSSTASNADIQRAAKRRKKADAEDENAPTRLPPRSHFFIEHVHACVHTQANTHTCLSARARRHIPQQPTVKMQLNRCSQSGRKKRCHRRKGSPWTLATAPSLLETCPQPT